VKMLAVADPTADGVHYDLQDFLSWCSVAPLAQGSRTAAEDVRIRATPPSPSSWTGLVEHRRQPGFGIQFDGAWISRPMRLCILLLAPILSRVSAATFQLSCWLAVMSDARTSSWTSTLQSFVFALF